MSPTFQYQSLQPKDVIEPNPPTIDSSKRVAEVVARMKGDEYFRRSSFVLVLEDAKLVGILTEPDIVRLIAEQVDFTATAVKQVMTNNPITLRRSDFLDINVIMKVMRLHQIRHLPIVDDLNQLEGLVSVDSVCRALHPSNLLKFRRVDEAMSTRVFQAPTTTSILKLSKMMSANRTSCIVITDAKSVPVGIITERDIVQFQTLGIDVVNTIAETVMSTPLACMKTTDSLLEVHQQMESLLVRRLVIVGNSGELRGMITQFSMLKVLDPSELFSVIETLQEELELRTNQLKQEKELAQITLQSIGDAVITTDATGNIINFNPMAESLTGWKSQEVAGQFLSNIFNIINEYTREPVANPIEEVLNKNTVVGLANHTILIARDGTEYSIEDSAAPICNNQGQLVGAVIVFRDVTESRQLNKQLSWQASHDPLTGLYNRCEFDQRLKAAIASAQSDGFCHSLCYLDLDQFKIVNDTCGHIAGDDLLKQVTSLLLQESRSTDILARVGGDEFALLLNQCPLSVAKIIANHLRQSVENFRFDWLGQTFSIGVSIGVVEISDDKESFDDIMNTADAACYMAKANGRNCVHVYQENDVELSRNLGERRWIVRLSQALEENRFCLYSQKIVAIKPDFADGLNIANRYEILLRLKDEQGQLVAPGVFIPAAERYNLMPSIDRWVISHFMANYNRYCQNIKVSQASVCDNSVYAINLSGASINSERFRLFLKEQFTLYDIDPLNICFEITETTAIANLAIASQFIDELKALGCSIALDDFGSGMSSLTYLKNLPIDYLKIDGSFVKNIASDRIDYATVESFNHISKIMGIKTVAEFVENEAIIQDLKQIGVDYAQGYGIESPQPLNFSNF